MKKTVIILSALTIFLGVFSFNTVKKINRAKENMAAKVVAELNHIITGYNYDQIENEYDLERCISEVKERNSVLETALDGYLNLDNKALHLRSLVQDYNYLLVSVRQSENPLDNVHYITKMNEFLGEYIDDEIYNMKRSYSKYLREKDKQYKLNSYGSYDKFKHEEIRPFTHMRNEDEQQ